jgi:hypothetical protein
MKTDLIFLLVIAVYIGYYLCKKETFTENFAAIDDARQAVREIYNMDVEAIRNLSEVAKRLQAGGLTHPGRLFVNAGGDHLPITAASNGEAHIALRSHNNEGINNYLINRGGHFRLHMHGVGDMFGVNRDGHHYVRHLGDHVAHLEGDGNNPYITLGKTGTWDRKKFYIQNVDAHTDNPTLRIATHGGFHFMDMSKSHGVRWQRKDGRWTHFDWENGWNYIRGPTQIDGDVNIGGQRLNLGNGWNIRTHDGHFRLYHNDDQQFVVHNPHAGAEWGNVIWGKRMRTDGDILVGGPATVRGDELRVGTDGRFAQITLPQFHIQSHWQHDAVRVANRININNRAAPGWFTDIGYQWGGGRRI